MGGLDKQGERRDDAVSISDCPFACWPLSAVPDALYCER
jgi:hypothetical protein